MRRLLLLSMFLFSISLFAQSTIGISKLLRPDTGWTVFANGQDRYRLFRVPNPDKSGINTIRLL